MAPNRREVDLIVRAKDDAVTVVNAVTAALNSMVGAQEKVTKAAKDTDGGFGGLVAAVTELDKALKGASGADKLAGDLEKAQKSLSSLRTELERAETGLEKVQREATEAAAATAKLRDQSAALEKQLSDQNARMTKSVAEADKLKTALNENNTTVNKLTKSIPNLTKQIADQEAKVTETAAKFERYSEGVRQAEKPSRTLQERLANTETRLTKQTARLEELRAKLTESKTTLEGAAAAVVQFKAGLESAEASIKEQTAAIAGTSAQIKNLKGSIKEAAAHERELDKEANKASVTLERQKGSLAGAEKNFETLSTAVGKAGAAMSEVAAKARGPLREAISAQQSAVSRINNEFQRVRSELAQVGAAMGRAGVPTKEMSETYARLTVALREISQSFNDQKATLASMRGEYANLSGDTAELAAVTGRFEQALEESAAALQRSQQIAAKAEGSNARLATSTQRAAVAQGTVVRETRQAATTTNQAAVATNRLSDAYRRLYGESRQAMSYTQRLRGEVLSLISAYGGIFGVIQMLGDVVNATTKLEGAQSRLNALYGGDQMQAAQEYEFIQRQANRLGIDIGDLADQYTKFTAATKGTVIAGEESRRIFLRVAEAGRVNGLSMDDMSGIFRALVQIASKGKVQLEELSGQLGDRLPGALQIMADGLGITVEELLKMTKEGEVSSSALSAFADNLEERYGDALPDALKNTSAVLGRFRNAVTEALLAFGQGGFIEGFNELLISMTETLRSADFRAFAENVSSAFGLIAKAMAFLAENFKLVVFAANAFLAIKLVPFLGSLALGFQRYGQSINQAAIQARVFNREQQMLAAQSGVAASRIGMLGVAARGIGGGLAGVGISVIVGILTNWITSADAVNVAMTEHEEIMQKVKSAYDTTKKSVEEWRKELALVSTKQLLDNIKQVEAAVETLVGERLSPFELIDPDMYPELGKIAQQVTKVMTAFFAGEKSAADYVKELNALSQEAAKLGVNGGPMSNAIEGAIKLAEADEKVVLAARDAKDALIVQTGETDKATEAMDRIMRKTEEASDATARITASSSKFNTALEEMKALIPEINKGLDEMKDKAKLDEAFQSAARAAQTISELAGAVNTYNSALNGMLANAAAKNLSGITSGVEAAATILRDREDFRSTPYWDVNANRIGFGSDTVTLDDGSVQKVVKGMRISVEDANRDLYRRIGEFNETIKGQIGSDTFSGFSPAQQGVLTSIAYNYGSLPQRIVDAIKNGGTDAQIAEAIRGLQNDNAGVNRERRLYEAAAFQHGTDVEGGTKAYLDEQKKITEEKEKQVEKTKELQQSEALALQTAELEASLKNADVVKRQTELELAKERAKYEREGIEFTKEAEESIRRRVELQYREQATQDAINAKKKVAEDAENRVNALITQREQLLKQSALFRAQGNTGAAEQATTQANALTAEIDKATAAAIRMWEAVGGTDAQAKIQSLRTAAMEAKNLANTGNAVQAMWTEVGRSLGENLVNAFDQFAQAVANGENAWKALGRAMQQAAAQFLIDIGKMIVRQMIFNAISGFFPGITPGANGLFHSGTGNGTFGSNLPNRSRSVDPRVFANAPRFHKGYNAGLKHGEMAAIVERTEAIMTEDSPFHPNNQAKTLGAAAAAGAGSGGPNIKIVNAIDAGDFVSEGLNTAVGEQAMLNFIRKNKSSFKEVVS